MKSCGDILVTLIVGLSIELLKDILRVQIVVKRMVM